MFTFFTGYALHSGVITDKGTFIFAMILDLIFIILGGFLLLCL